MNQTQTDSVSDWKTEKGKPKERLTDWDEKRDGEWKSYLHAEYPGQFKVLRKPKSKVSSWADGQVWPAPPLLPLTPLPGQKKKTADLVQQQEVYIEHWQL